MLAGFRSLDRVLRGDATRPAVLGTGNIDVPLRGLVFVVLLLAMFYGVCVGTYALVSRWGTPYLHDGIFQMISGAIKLPALLLFTLLVTTPSLYVFNALLGSRLTPGGLIRLLTATIGVLTALLASFGTILVFFSLCTESYSFVVLLNVALFSVAGLLGLGFLLQTLNRLARAALMTPAASLPDADDTLPGPLDRLPDHRDIRSVRRVFAIWVVVFGLVGSQMSWILRPFILAPNSGFVVFRQRDSNFFEAVMTRAADLATPTRTKPEGGESGWRR